MAEIQNDMVTYKTDSSDNHAGVSLEKLNPLKSTFIHGPSSIKQSNYGEHPLETMEKTRLARKEYLDYQILRSVQGIHAPLRLLTERNAAAKIGHLPFLPRSNLQLDVLTGRDELIMPEDILNNPREFGEVQLPPHMSIERELKLL